jgi:hypothetical protein
MPIADLGFLAGLWAGPDFRMQLAPPWAGAMLGTMQAAEGDRTVYWEYLRFAEEGDTLVFHPMQLDRPLGAFRLAELAPGRAVFTGADDPLLKRLTFETDAPGERFVAIVEGEQDGVPFRQASLLQRLAP